MLKNLREVNWFHKSWILAAVCSHGFSLPIEANCLSKYFFTVEDGFGSTLWGSKIGFENSPNVRENLIGLVKIGSCLQDAR